MNRRILVLLLPLILLLFFTIVYGAWQDQLNLNISFVISEKPAIEIRSRLQNTKNNLVTLVVDNATRTIESTDPTPLEIFINITNTGSTPISKLTVNNKLPVNWNPIQQPLIRYVETDGDTAPIDLSYLTIEYEQTTGTLWISIQDMKATIGKFLNPNESVLTTLSIAYTMIGNQLPLEHEVNTLFFENRATATAYIKSWQSQPITSNLIFSTNIYWI